MNKKTPKKIAVLTVTAGFMFAFSITSAAQTQGSCPSIIASLFPKNASICSGQYFPGDMGRGNGSADLSFANPSYPPSCPKAKYSARISVEVTYYGGEAAILIKSEESPYGTIDRDAIQEEAIQSAAGWFVQTTSQATPKREKLGIGEIAYVEYMSECPSEEQVMADIGKMNVPNIKLEGMAWMNTANLKVKLEGLISVDLAKAAVAEVFENLKKADFSKAK